jgi:LysM repeat protein
MKEADRLARNTQRLTEMFDDMAPVVRRVLNRMEAQKFRPRIQAAWRSKEDQLLAFQGGTSQVKFGFHNVTGVGGAKESLACDVLDDDHPLGPATKYLLALAIAARAEGLETGILWSLKPALQAGVEAAIAARDIDRPVKVGFDPTHIQPVGITIAQAKAGKRPTFKAAKAAPNPGPKKFHIVAKGETLGGIAKRFSLSLDRILQLNPQKHANPNLITRRENPSRLTGRATLPQPDHCSYTGGSV